MTVVPTFTVDEANSDEERIYVDVAGRGTVLIQKTDEGLVIDVYPFHVADGPVASTWVTTADLMPDPAAEEVKP